MKRIKHLFTALLLLCATAVAAHDFEVGGIYYSISSYTNKTVEVTYGGYYSNEYTGSVVIPESVIYNGTTYSVKSIGSEAFYCCSGLTSITIPNSVTSIGSSAFYGCTGLTNVTIGNSVTRIGHYAFEYCSGLKEVHISDLTAWCDIDFTSYNANPLRYAKNLYLNGELVTELVIPGGVKKIKNHAFEGCSGLTSVVIGDGVTSIGSEAFYSCSGLTSITIPNSVTSIGNYAFEFCFGLQVVCISALTAWCGIDFFGGNGTNPLFYAKNLYLNGELVTELVIPDGIKEIKNYTFAGCTGLTSITIPNSVTSIGDYAFNACTGLTSVTIPNSVTSIGDLAFNNCTGLTSVTIPNSVTSIGDRAFGYCTGLTSITIPNSVTSIGNQAFYDCDGLTSITIPNSVTVIGYEAFYDCDGLTSVEIPNSVTSIGKLAFFSCNNLTSVEIPNSVTSIGSSAFYNCTGLTSITSLIPAESLFDINSDVFYNVDKTFCTLYVPVGTKDTYASTKGWKDFVNIVEKDFTGIDEVFDEVKGEIGKVKTVYDLNGRAVENPTNGVYIINGKKVIIK